MYETGIGHLLPAATTTTVVAMLPNAGGDLVVQLGIAVAAGMIVWAVLYAYEHKVAQTRR